MNDLKFAFRQLLKNPGFTAVAVLTLALGIGVNTSMFSALHATMLRPLPYPEADRLVRVYRTSPHSQTWPHSVANFRDHQTQNQVFERMAAMCPATFSLAEPGQPAERARGLLVSPDLFPLLGIQPTLGRAFTADEDVSGRNNVVILSQGFWRQRFAGEKSILGRTLRLDGESVTVVGVMPARFSEPRLSGRTDVWRPLVFTDDQRQNRGNNWLQSVARLKPAVSLVQAQTTMDALAANLNQAYPASNSGEGIRLVRFAESGNQKNRSLLWLVMALAGFVLLIACANLANLQFARTSGRAREIAIRSALGAPRGRVLGQLLTESLLIALLGGLLGVVLANWGNAWLGRQIPNGGEPGVTLPLNLSVLGFAFAATTFAGLAFGLVPAWLASRSDVNTALKQGSRGTTGDHSQHRLRHALVVAQVSLALVLLTGAGVMVRGLHRFASQDQGWQVDGLMAGYLTLPEGNYGSDGQRFAFTERLRERLTGLPGVERIAMAESLPVRGFDAGATFIVEDRPEPPKGHEPQCSISGVTPGYFATLGMRLAAGRDFTTTDTADHPAVVIINEAMARTFWPGESAIGKRIGSPEAWREIVGVVSDVRFPANIDEPSSQFQSYRPLAQELHGKIAIAVRGKVPTETLRQAVAELDPDMVLNDPGPVHDAVERHMSGPILIGRMLGGFAVLGLFLAVLGLYGVIAGFVAERTTEIGVRMALGAQLRDVLWLVVGQGLRLTLLGTMLGMIGAFGISRLLASASQELASKDPLTFVFVAALLVAVALMACWLPARRAARIDPMEALRTE